MEVCLPTELPPPTQAELDFLDTLRKSYLEATVPAQSIADEIVDDVFDKAFAIILEHFFDRQAVPYAITWATKQMTDALFAAFQGPDTGVGVDAARVLPPEHHHAAARSSMSATSEGLPSALLRTHLAQGSGAHIPMSGPMTWGSWHADPEPSRVPMDACSRSTLRVVYRPRPVTPEAEGLEEDLDATVAALSQTKSGRHLNKRLSSNVASRKGSFANKAAAASANSSAARSAQRSIDNSAHSSASRDRSDMLSVATSGSSGKETAEGKSPASDTTPKRDAALTAAVTIENASFASHVDSELTSPQESSKRARQRALELERQLDEVFRRQSPGSTALVPPATGAKSVPAATQPHFVVDGVAGKVVMVLPVEHRKVPPSAEVQFGVVPSTSKLSPQDDASQNSPPGRSPPNASPTRSSPVGAASNAFSARKGKGGGPGAEFYREENGQQLVCSVDVPAIGVAVRDRGETRMTRSSDVTAGGSDTHSSGYGDGRVTKRVFNKIQQVQASERLNSSEGFREYFPHGPRFAAPALLSPPPLASTTPVVTRNTAGLDGMEPLTLTVDGNDLSGGVDPTGSLHEQYRMAIAERAGREGPSRHRVGGGGPHGRQRPPHHLLGLPPKAAAHTKQYNTQSSSHDDAHHTPQKQSYPPAVLPSRRPDLLPPLHTPGLDNYTRTLSPAPAASPVSPGPFTSTFLGGAASSSGGGAPAAVQDFVKLQREKDAPHFKPGKPGSITDSQRKDALQYLSEQESIIQQRRATKIIVPAQLGDDAAADGGNGSSAAYGKGSSIPIAPPKLTQAAK